MELCIRRKATATKQTPPDIRRDSELADQFFSFSAEFGTVRDFRPTFNALIFSSRELSQQNDTDSHYSIVRLLYAAISGIEETVHINLEICRPGTWSALYSRVTGQKKGFYNIVLIDMSFEEK